MPERRYIVSISFGFGIFAPFAFSPPWIFSALRWWCTTTGSSRAPRCSRLKLPLNFRSVCPVAYTRTKHLSLLVCLPRDSETVR